MGLGKTTQLIAYAKRHPETYVFLSQMNTAFLREELVREGFPKEHIFFHPRTSTDLLGKIPPGSRILIDNLEQFAQSLLGQRFVIELATIDLGE